MSLDQIGIYLSPTQKRLGDFYYFSWKFHLYFLSLLPRVGSTCSVEEVVCDNLMLCQVTGLTYASDQACHLWQGGSRH